MSEDEARARRREADRRSREKAKLDPVRRAKRREWQRKADANRRNDPARREWRRAYFAVFNASPKGKEKARRYETRRQADPVRRARRSEQAKARYASNPELRAKSAAYKKEWKKLNRERVNTRSQEYYARKRAAVFAHYGQVCVCCGETEEMFLTVDHPNNDGNEHKKVVGSQGIYRWLVKNGFPDGFRILCYNCNSGRWRNGGECPHEVARRQAVASSLAYVSEGSLQCSSS